MIGARYKELQEKWQAMFDGSVGESAVAGLIGSWCHGGGARAAFAALAAKRAAWTEISGEGGAGRVGTEGQMCVVEEKDGNGLLRDDV